MTALTKIENFSPVLDVCDDVEKMRQMAKKLMESKHYQKIGEDGIFAIGMTAKSWGMPIIDALNGELYYVQGRVGMSAEAMNKRIRMAGHSITLKRLDENGCVLVGKRKDTGDTAEISFTGEDMRSAGKDYSKNRKDMFFARAISRLKRVLFPDIGTKVYVKEEIDEILAEEKLHQIDAEIANVKPLYIETISIAQAIELANIFNQCSDTVKTNFMSFLKTKFNIEVIDDIPSNEFDKIKDMLVKRRDDYQKQLVEAELANRPQETQE